MIDGRHCTRLHFYFAGCLNGDSFCMSDREWVEKGFVALLCNLISCNIYTLHDIKFLKQICISLCVIII